VNNFFFRKNYETETYHSPETYRRKIALIFSGACGIISEHHPAEKEPGGASPVRRSRK